MKTFLRHPHQGRIALLLFLLAYAATLALVIAHERVKAAMDAHLTPPAR